MTTCNRCSSTTVAWGAKKDGSPILMEASVPHFVSCKAKLWARPKKPKARTNSKPELSEEDTEMLGALTGLGWNAEKVEHLLPHAKGDTFEARFRAVMAYADSEGGSR